MTNQSFSEEFYCGMSNKDQDTPDDNVKYQVSNPPITEGVEIREGQTIYASSYRPVERTYSLQDVERIQAATKNYVGFVAPNRDLLTRVDFLQSADYFKEVPALRTICRLTKQVHEKFPEFFNDAEKSETSALYARCNHYCNSRI